MCISISIYFAFVDLMNLQIISKYSYETETPNEK